MEFKELTLEELTKGFIYSKEERCCCCIFCGESFEDGLIYNSRNRMVTPEKAMEEHIADVHNGTFYGLIGFDKQVNGFSDIQKEILEGMYLGNDNKLLGDKLGISATTVRTHKFNIQKLKREAKILLATLEQIENEEIVEKRKKTGTRKEISFLSSDKDNYKLDQSMSGNRLHPYFGQINLK